jgi:hypothetical protein
MPSARNAVQHSENVRNSLVLNYKSAALNQLSYAGVPIRKPLLASSSRLRHDRSLAHARRPVVHGRFSTVRQFFVQNRAIQ